jgi:hypothetical protein
MDDFRATATAFSQLTGVLGGFSMTILVLVLGFAGGNKSERDWAAGLLLIAGTAYIVSSAHLANCMNVGIFSRFSHHRDEIFKIQSSTFSFGIMLFHLGNVFLPAAIIVIVYQESLVVGLVASAVVFVLAVWYVTINFYSMSFLPYRTYRGDIRNDTPGSTRQTSDSEGQVESTTWDGLGWPPGNHASRE